MKLLLSTALLPLVLNTAIDAVMRNLIKDLLQDYPSRPDCDLHYVTDQVSKFNSLTMDTWTYYRAVTLWKVSANKDKFFNMTVLWRDSPNCELVFVDTGQLLTADFLKLMHSQGLLGQSLFYAIKLESTNLLLEMNITEIYDFSHVVFLVDKVMVFCISFPFNLRKKLHGILYLAKGVQQMQPFNPNKGVYVVNIQLNMSNNII